MSDFNPDDFDFDLPPIEGLNTGPDAAPSHPSMYDVDGDDDEFSDTIDPGEGFMEMNLAMQNADDTLSKLGLYTEGVMPYPDPTGQPGFIGVMVCTIGDVAFTDRVQNPEKAETDKAFGAIQHDAGKDEFLDRRVQIQENLAAGRSAFDDGTDNEEDE